LHRSDLKQWGRIRPDTGVPAPTALEHNLFFAPQCPPTRPARR
jgi:hypothetical protein